MSEKQDGKLSRRRFTLTAATGISVSLAGCGSQNQNHWNPDQSPTEPGLLVINTWELTAVESDGDDYKLECLLSIQNTETEYAVASDITISTTVDGTKYSESDEIAVKSGSTAEFGYDLGDGNLPEKTYHSVNANSSDVTLEVSVEGTERVTESSSGSITGNR